MFQAQHDVLPDQTHDEFAREEFCGTMRKFFTETLWPGTRDVYAGQVGPAFQRANNRAPENVREMKAAMEDSFYYRASNLLGRCAQELLWDTVGESIERQIPQLRERAAHVENPIGSLELHPEVQIPKYVDAVDIHVMPGNFHTELAPDDVFSGALYDRGVFYFAYGGMGPKNDKLGAAMSGWFKEQFPDFKPKRILDMGCGAGFATLPWKELYPEAEVYGVDIAAPMVRYAHARAESWGQAIHFSQQNAAETNFPDGYFDVVTSCLLTHELPVAVIKSVLAESHRVLAPGGIVMADGGAVPAVGAEQEFFASWFMNNVNEPFQSGLKRLDFSDALTEAGFLQADHFESGLRDAVYLTGMSRNKKQAAGGSAGYVGSIRR